MKPTTKEYEIQITETLKKRVSVYAESQEKALEKVEQAWKNEAVVLDESNFNGVDFGVINIRAPKGLPKTSTENLRISIPELMAEYLKNSPKVSFNTYAKNRLSTDKMLILISE